MEKQLWWACKLGGAEPLGVFKAGQTVLARLKESQIWHQPTGSVGRGFRKGQWPLLTLLPDTSGSPCISLVSFKLFVTLVLELRGSESE